MQIKKAYELLKQYKTPKNVIKHAEKVKDVARQIALEYCRKGFDLNVELIESAALLHDILRVKGNSHADDGAKILTDLGYPEEANLVKKHKYKGLILPGYELRTIEEKIIHYSDKRVKGDEVVTMEERFKDWKKRFHDNEQEKVIKACYQLEKELFDPIDLKPEDIK